MLSVYCADYLLPITSPPIENAALAVEDDVILAVGTRAEVMPPLQGQFRVVECGRAAILPGFVNTHAHLELSVMRGFLEERDFHTWIRKLIAARSRLSKVDLQISALFGAVEAARGGVTTLADTGESGAALYGLYESGLRGVVFQEVFGPRPEQAESSLEGLKERVAELKARSTALIEIGISPHAPYSVSPELYRLASTYALEEGLKVAVHAAESKAEDELVRYGSGVFARSLKQRGIAYRPSRSVTSYLAATGILETSPLLIHMVRTCAEDLDVLKSYGCKIAHCPKSNAKFGHGRAQVERMLEAGLRVGLGSDSVASNNSMDMLEEARFMYLLHSASLQDSNWMTARQILSLITLKGAEALGIDFLTGSLEVGKQADFCVINLDKIHALPVHDVEAAIVFSASGRDVELTVVAGREVYSGGVMSGVDENSLRQEIARVVKKL